MTQLEKMRQRWTGQCHVLLFTPGRYCEYYAACETRSGDAHPHDWKPHVGSVYDNKTIVIDATKVAFHVCCRVVADGPMLDPLMKHGAEQEKYLPRFLRFVPTVEYCDMWTGVGATINTYDNMADVGFFQ